MTDKKRDAETESENMMDLLRLINAKNNSGRIKKIIRENKAKDPKQPE